MEQKAFILVLGGNEVASAIAVRLHAAGIRTVLWVSQDETYLRHNLCFGAVQYWEKQTIEGIEGRQLPEEWMDQSTGTTGEKVFAALEGIWLERQIPVLVDIPLPYFEEIPPGVVIETRLPAEQTEQTPMEAEPLPFSVPIVGLIPYHLPGRNVTAAVETRLNYHLGRVYFEVKEVPRAPRLDSHFFHLPFETIHTPIEGVWVAMKEIGDPVAFNEPLGKVNDIEIRSAEDGQIWGISPSGRYVSAGQSIALIFKGRPTEDYRFFSFQERAIASGVLQALERIL